MYLFRDQCGWHGSHLRAFTKQLVQFYYLCVVLLSHFFQPITPWGETASAPAREIAAAFYLFFFPSGLLIPGRLIHLHSFGGPRFLQRNLATDNCNAVCYMYDSCERNLKKNKSTGLRRGIEKGWQSLGMWLTVDCFPNIYVPRKRK